MWHDFLSIDVTFAIAAALVCPAKSLKWLVGVFKGVAYVNFAVICLLLFKDGFWWLFTMIPYATAAGCLWYRVSELDLCRKRQLPVGIVAMHFLIPLGCCTLTLIWHGLAWALDWGNVGLFNSLFMIGMSVASLFVSNIRVPVAMFDACIAFNSYKEKGEVDKSICDMGDNARIVRTLLNLEVKSGRLVEMPVCGTDYIIKAKSLSDLLDLIRDICKSVPRMSIAEMCADMATMDFGPIEFAAKLLCRPIERIRKCRFTDGVYLVHSRNFDRLCICPVCGTVTFADKESDECHEAYCSDTCRETGKAYEFVECGTAEFCIISDEEFEAYVNGNPLESKADTSFTTTSAKDIAKDFAGHAIKKQGAKAVVDVAADELGELGGTLVKNALRARESIKDVAKYMDGKMSSTQLTKNLVTQGGGIAGAMAGGTLGQILIPIPIVGACIGSWVGGKLGKTVAGGVAEGFGEDDAVVVRRGLMEVFQFLSVRYCLKHAEMDILFNAVEATNTKEYVEEVVSSEDGVRPHIAKTLLPVINRIVRKSACPMTLKDGGRKMADAGTAFVAAPPPAARSSMIPS